LARRPTRDGDALDPGTAIERRFPHGLGAPVGPVRVSRPRPPAPPTPAGIFSAK